MSDLKQLEKELKAPFHPDDIEWRVGSTTKDKTRGLALAYVTNRAIQNRLDEVFGIAGWKNEYKDWKGSGVLCGLSCLVNGEWITKWDGAEETNMEATKGGLSDAMKRAGYQWGIGRYLYKLESKWVPLEQRGSSYVIKSGEEPELPEWALPEGFTYGNKPTPPPKKANQSDALKPLENEELNFLGDVRLGDPLPGTNGNKSADKKCTCGKPLSPGIIKYCEQHNINPPTCMDCRKPQAQGAR